MFLDSTNQIVILQIYNSLLFMVECKFVIDFEK